MQIVIEIPEEEFNYYQIAKVENPTLLESAIKNGTPLPKGHGRIVDIDAVIVEEDNQGRGILWVDAPTIIEADKKGDQMERGIELVSVGRVETRDECLLEILKENGFYLKYEKMPKYDREYYIIMTPKED